MIYLSSAVFQSSNATTALGVLEIAFQVQKCGVL